MNIQMIGTGDITSSSFTTSFLVDSFLINTPPGTLKQLKQMAIELDNISLIIINNLHGEVYFDLPMLIKHEFLRQRSKPLIIIGPKELKKKVKHLTKLAFNDTECLGAEFLTFADAALIQNSNLIDDYYFSFINVKHDIFKNSLALMIRKGEITLGYTGEARLGPGLSYLLKAVKICLINVNEDKKGKLRGLAISEFMELAASYNLTYIPLGFPDELQNELAKIKNVKIINSYEQFYI